MRKSDAMKSRIDLECEVLALRRLLWIAHSHGIGYGDDGEMQDCSRIPFIDFKRNTVADIETKILMRNQAAIQPKCADVK
jgi:hypothetical protein